jgi:CheY-like chemotaxis protein
MPEWRDGVVGLRILVVEDEVMIAIMLESMLEDFGCEVVGLASSIEEALTTIRQEVMDGVLLDMNLQGRNTNGVADELHTRAVPFLLVTGYEGMDSDPPLIRAAPRLQKPFSREELGRRMTEAFVASAHGQAVSARRKMV